MKEDAATRDNIASQQRSSREQADQWARDISYEAEIGLVLKDRLRLSPSGVSWKNDNYALNEVTRIGWGATKHSINGIPTGTTYKVLFGNDVSLSQIMLGQEQIFTDFVDRLWKAVGVRLVMELVRGLQEGKQYSFGEALLNDRGVRLPKHHLFKANEEVYGSWDRVRVWSAEGAFNIGFKDDKKAHAALPYQEPNNAHVVEAAIRAAFKRGADRLSDVLSAG